MPLEEYQRKRDFAHTPEPTGGGDAGAALSLSFVVHKHAATALHYDFRLELDGVLLSWAVPKGPSLDPHDKRLAVHVEDHPLEYGGFEGTIPKGEYGGGTVIIWDRGTWEPVGDPHAGLARGDFKFVLHGEKLRGLWVLVHMKPRPGEKREMWLLIKEKDEFVRPHDSYDVLAEEPASVASGLTIGEVAAGGRAEAVGGDGVSASANIQPQVDEPASIPANGLGQPASGGGSGSKPKTSKSKSGASSKTATPTTSGAKARIGAASFPGAVDLELATLVDSPPEGDGWIAEAKYDGYRVTLALDGGRCRAYTRRHADWSDRFAPLCRAVEGLPAVSAILDGEAIVLDDAGVSRFELLQAALGSHPERLAYAAFDLLYLNGFDLRDQPLAMRKQLLRTLLADEPATGTLRFADHTDSSAHELYAQACTAGLEGVVCKRADSRYIAGRGHDWRKIKCRHTQELVVGGFTEGQGSREPLGSLLVGTYEDGRLVYAGRVGSGLDEATIARLRGQLEDVALQTSPFEPAPKVTGHVVHWARPKLVVEVAFREWTADGVLRQPVFLGVREDKVASEVVRERAEALPAQPAAAPESADAARSGSAVVPDSDRRDFGRPTSVLGVRVTNPEKPLFPDSAFPKLSLAEYYAAVAPVMLPHVAHRPLTLVRCPLGHGRACFYQRHPDAGLPAQVHTFDHALTGHANADRLLFVEDAEGLVALAQMGALEIHTWLSHVDAPARADRIVFDLDPGPGVTWPLICSAARTVREECAALGFEPFVKSTGSKGLHVTIAIEPVWEFARVRALAKAIVDRIVSDHADTLTGKMAKDRRGGRIFLDYLRNSEGASAVAPYSTRNLMGPSCSVPLAWDELADDLDIRAFTPGRVIARVASGVDPWKELGEHAAGVRMLRKAEAALGKDTAAG